tara:strand:- start:217 stop:918 length:702 start_codon:yes stop_codon:yes gene_type:complete
MLENKSGDQNTKFEIFNINPEPLGLFTLPNERHLKYKKLIQSIWKNPKDELMQNFSSEPYTKHICNKQNQNLFKSFPILHELRNDLGFFITSYINNIGFKCDEIIINSAWLNNAQKESTLNSHYHVNSYISGNYFVNFNPELHSSLTFKNDRNPLVMSPSFSTIACQQNPDNKTIYTANSININAKEGQIVLWRSYLIHGYSTPNKGDNRMTLSFNSMPKILSDGIYSFKVSE